MERMAAYGEHEIYPVSARVIICYSRLLLSRCQQSSSCKIDSVKRHKPCPHRAYCRLVETFEHGLCSFLTMNVSMFWWITTTQHSLSSFDSLQVCGRNQCHITRDGNEDFFGTISTASVYGDSEIAFAMQTNHHLQCWIYPRAAILEALSNYPAQLGWQIPMNSNLKSISAYGWAPFPILPIRLLHKQYFRPSHHFSDEIAILSSVWPEHLCTAHVCCHQFYRVHSSCILWPLAIFLKPRKDLTQSSFRLQTCCQDQNYDNSINAEIQSIRMHTPPFDSKPMPLGSSGHKAWCTIQNEKTGRSKSLIWMRPNCDCELFLRSRQSTFGGENKLFAGILHL